MPILRVLLPNLPPVSHVLTGTRVTVGRRPDNTIQILDPSVSAHHAELLLVGEHYRLHDLESTNLSAVEGIPVSDFHLHQSCRLAFGSVECEYDAAPLRPAEPSLSTMELEKDVAFLRTENQDLREKIHTLQRQIDILSSARLVTGKGETAGADPELLKRLVVDRDEARYQNSGLKLEIEKLRAEVDAASRERDAARRSQELLRMERAALQELKEDGDGKGSTQRIIFPAQTPERVGP